MSIADDDRVARLEARVQGLERENARRLAPLGERPPAAVTVSDGAAADRAARSGAARDASSSRAPAEKIALFRTRFVGREDPYARRWESRCGTRSGYAPVCTNEWQITEMLPEADGWTNFTRHFVHAKTGWTGLRSSCSATSSDRRRSRDADRSLGDHDALRAFGTDLKDHEAEPLVGALVAHHHRLSGLWGERFDAEPHDLSAAEDELARTISAMTAAELERAEQARLERRQSDDLDAWEHVVLGNALLQRCTGRDNELARSCFRQALVRDPGYGDAFAGMAFGHLRDLFALRFDERAGPLREGERAAARAVALDCNSSLAHHALATVHVWAGRDELMLRETELAVALNPSNAGARMALGNRLDLVGRTTEGIAEMTASLGLDPRNPRRFVCMGFLARASLSIGEHETALQWAYQAARLRPDLPDPHFRLALCLAHLGRIEEARAALEDCERSSAGALRRLGAWRPYASEDRSDAVLEGLRRHALLGKAIG